MKNWKGRSNIFISTWPKTGKDAENLPVSDDIIRVMKARLLADKVVRGNEICYSCQPQHITIYYSMHSIFN